MSEPSASTVSRPSSPRPAFLVQPPFDHNTHADLVLKSSDGHHFYVSKVILAFASPVLRDMITVTPPPPLTKLAIPTKQTMVDRLPIIDMSELKAQGLDMLLRIIYPVQTPSCYDAEMLLNLARAAEKYDSGVVKAWVDRSLRRKIAASKTGQEAINIYVIAFTYGWKETARLAALASLRYPPSSSYSPLLDHLSAGAVARLFDLRWQVIQVVLGLFSTTVTAFSKQVSTAYYCVGGSCFQMSPFTFGVASDHKARSLYWDRLRKMVLEEIQSQSAPLSEKIMSTAALSSQLAGLECTACRNAVLNSFPQLLESFKSEMTRKATAVRTLYSEV